MLRSLRFNKEIEREKFKSKLRKKKRENQNWSRLKSYMCTFEKSLNKEGWLNYKNHFISSKHAQLDTVSVNPISLKLSSKIKYISFREGSVTGNKNFLNSVSGKVSLNVAQGSGFKLPTKCFVYYPEINEIYWFNGGFDGFVEFKNNLNFIVAFLKEDLISFSVKDEFVKEIRSMFQEKSPIDYSIIKPFKKYSLQEFWNMMEALK